MDPMTPEIYAEAHGCTWEDFTRAGCTWVRFRWRGKEYDAIRFPEGDGARMRLFGSPDKWVPERKGMSPRLWGLSRAVKLAHEQGDPALLLVNGQSSVIALQSARLPAFTIPGGEGNIAGFLMRGLAAEVQTVWQGPIVVMLDGDGAGRKAAPEALHSLRQAGITTWAVDPGDGMDAADSLRLRGADAIRALLEQPTPAPVSSVSSLSHGSRETDETGRWRLYTFDDLGKLPPTTWLIDRRIAAGSLNLLYGPSGTGKSFRALDYALQIAEAHPDRCVVYIAPEGGQGYHKRALAWSLHFGRPVPLNIVWLLDAPRLDDPAQHAELVSQLTPYRPICVLIDTLARCAVGLDENSAKDMGILINGCDELRKSLARELPGAIPCAVVLVHHTGKSGTGYRGSSALIAAADMAIELQPDGDTVREECVKAKDDKPFDPVLLTLHSIPNADSCVMVPASGRVDILAPISRSERRILEILNLAIFREAGAKAVQVQEASGYPKPSCYRLLSSLKVRGFLTQSAKGDPYFITGTGEQVVSRKITGPDAEVSSRSVKSQEDRETWAASQDDRSSTSPPCRGDVDDRSETAASDRSETRGYRPIPGFDDEPQIPSAADVAERLKARQNGGKEGGHGEE